MKRCTSCKVEKSLSEFYKNKLKKDGVQAQCKVCVGAYRRLHNEKINAKARIRLWWKKFSLTPADYVKLLEEQGGVCAICRKDKRSVRGYFDVDHDHTTGMVRGLLCGDCNRAIGLFKENLVNLQTAISYLLKHR